jgi:hypothetical protein
MHTLEPRPRKAAWHLGGPKLRALEPILCLLTSPAVLKAHCNRAIASVTVSPISIIRQLVSPDFPHSRAADADLDPLSQHHRARERAADETAYLPVP